MLLTPHTLIGIAVGASIPNPVISVPFALALHFVGDLVPHWDFFSNTRDDKSVRLSGWRPLAVMADLVLGVAVGLTATLYALWVSGDSFLALNIFLCGAVSALPDALEAPSIYGVAWGRRFFGGVQKIQSKLQFQAPLPWGLISQAIVVLVSLLLISNSMILR